MNFNPQRKHLKKHSPKTSKESPKGVSKRSPKEAYREISKEGPKGAPPKSDYKGASKGSWQGVNKWYKKQVGSEGHYYHRQVVLPQLLKLMAIKEEHKLLDLACGQGILERKIPPACGYQGFDISKDLIDEAEKSKVSKAHLFAEADCSKPLKAPSDFTHAAIVLALQNIQNGKHAIVNAAQHLVLGGKLFIVLNHPYFRIPRQSSWQVDEQKKLQYRRIDSYLSPLEVPIAHEPSKAEQSKTTWSFHHPLQDYMSWLKEAGFALIDLEEWCSDKLSEGKAAKMENRSRKEFPLFMTLVAQKLG